MLERYIRCFVKKQTFLILISRHISMFMYVHEFTPEAARQKRATFSHGVLYFENYRRKLGVSAIALTT